MSTAPRPTVAVCLLWLLAGCASAGGSVTSDGGRWVVQPEPVDLGVGWGEAGFVLQDSDGAAAPGRDVTCDVWMPAHGHGSSEPVTTTDAGEGLYRVEAFFTMPGEWEVRCDVVDGGTSERFTYLVEVFAE